MSGGKDNLIPFNKQTEEEQRENAKKGGIASGEARRRKKTLKDITNQILAAKVKDEKLAQTIREMGEFEYDDEITNDMVLIFSLMDKAVKNGKNSVNAFKELKTLAGEDDPQKYDMNLNVNPSLEESAQRIMDVINGLKDKSD